MFEISVTTPTLQYHIYDEYMLFVVIVITNRALFAYCLQCIVWLVTTIRTNSMLSLLQFNT